MTVAEIRLVGRSDIFIATSARIERDVLHVEGRWRRRVGANYGELRFGPRRSYSWPLRRCDEIRWIAEMVA